MIANEEEAFLLNEAAIIPPEESLDSQSQLSQKNKAEAGVCSDKIPFLLLACLYFVQAFPIGLFGASIPIILTEKKVSFEELGELTIMGLPFVFKIFFAPVFDSFKPNKYGKRKSFIVPIQLIGGILLILISFWIEGLVRDRSTHIITALGLLVISISAIQDVIVDGWVVSLVTKHNLAYVPTVQRMASGFAYFISFNLFIPLNSVKFCNEHIFSKPRATPLITLSGFMIFMGVFFIVVTIFLHFFDEKAIPREHQTTFKEIMGALKKFWRHPKLRIIVIFLITSGFSLLPVLSLFTPSMIQQGIDKETITNIVTACIPFRFIGVVVAGYINKKYKHELKVLSICFILDIFYILIPVGISLYLNPQTQRNEVIIGIAIVTALTSTTYSFIYSSLNGYSFRIAHESMATTFLVVLFSLGNFGRYWPSLVALLLGNHISIPVLGAVCFIYSIFYQIFLWKKFVPLEKEEPEAFGFYKEIRRDDFAGDDISEEPLIA